MERIGNLAATETWVAARQRCNERSMQRMFHPQSTPCHSGGARSSAFGAVAARPPFAAVASSVIVFTTQSASEAEAVMPPIFLSDDDAEEEEWHRSSRHRDYVHSHQGGTNGRTDGRTDGRTWAAGARHIHFCRRDVDIKG